ncbi:alpha/beta hydrolase fold domain-containing protein [Paraburkholderia agricolaris]|uniref:Alpha/beta hydrolase fold domain-containing protein n=1 Tax=Paraburkholderia agricolaris TaxID=2152888 RepID=A0ABW9A0H2_9BURK
MNIQYFSASDEDRRFAAALLGDGGFTEVYASPQSAGDMREATRSILQSNSYAIDAPGVVVTSSEVAGVPCEKIVTSDADANGLIVFLHGGGFVRGSLELGRRSAIELAALSKRPVLAIGFRQAPEHRFPAASLDVLHVYRTLLAQGHESRAIVFVGESAGGCLALTLPARVMRGECPLPAGMAGLCPMADLRMHGASWHVNAARDIATREMGERMLDLYIDDADKGDPLAAPLNTPYDANANVLLCVGANEVMLSDVERFADHADRAGARVALNLYETMPHGFTKFDTPLARKAMRHTADWCVDRLADAR